MPTKKNIEQVSTNETAYSLDIEFIISITTSLASFNIVNETKYDSSHWHWPMLLKESTCYHVAGQSIII